MIHFLSSDEVTPTIGQIEGLADKVARQIMNQAEWIPRQAAGIVTLVAMMMGLSKLFSSLLHWVKADQDGSMTILVSSLSMVGLGMLASRFSDPFGAAVKQFTLTLVPPTPNGNSSQPLPADPELWLIYQQTQKNYNLNRQVAVGRILSFQQNLENRLYRALNPAGKTPEEQRRYTVDQVANAAIQMRLLHRDIGSDSKYSEVPFKTCFKDHYGALEGLPSEVYARILQLDEAIRDPAVQVYYRNLMASWLQ